MRAPRDLRLLSGAVLLSAAGDLLMVVVLSLRVHDLTGSGFAVAGVFATLMAPVVLLAPLAGRLVDRTETRRLLMAVSAGQAVPPGRPRFPGGPPGGRARCPRRPAGDPRTDHAAGRGRRGGRPGRGVAGPRGGRCARHRRALTG